MLSVKREYDDFETMVRDDSVAPVEDDDPDDVEFDSGLMDMVDPDTDIDLDDQDSNE